MPSDFQSTATLLFREAFEGREADKDYTWFVEKKEGIFDALNSVDSRQASKKPSGACSSIAGHAYHMLYALRGANTVHGGAKPEGTWTESWSRQSVSSADWEELKTEIATEYQTFISWFESNQDWSDDETRIGALAALPHMAFHLGAIRQILKVI